nr:trypsin eta-like [Drosophila kikkawai]
MIFSFTRCRGAAAPGRDACKGDSGGPLVDIENGHLSGIVSWGSGYADPRYPGIYADVAFFKDWIGEVISNSSLFLSDNRSMK